MPQRLHALRVSLLRGQAVERRDFAALALSRLPRRQKAALSEQFAALVSPAGQTDAKVAAPPETVPHNISHLRQALASLRDLQPYLPAEPLDEMSAFILNTLTNAIAHKLTIDFYTGIPWPEGLTKT